MGASSSGAGFAMGLAGARFTMATIATTARAVRAWVPIAWTFLWLRVMSATSVASFSLSHSASNAFISSCWRLAHQS